MIKKLFLLLNFVASSLAMQQGALCPSWIQDTSHIIILSTIDWPQFIQIPIQAEMTVDNIKAIVIQQCIDKLEKNINARDDNNNFKNNTKLCAYYRSWKTLKLWNHNSEELLDQELITKYMEDWNTAVFSFSLKQ